MLAKSIYYIYILFIKVSSIYKYSQPIKAYKTQDFKVHVKIYSKMWLVIVMGCFVMTRQH